MEFLMIIYLEMTAAIKKWLIIQITVILKKNVLIRSFEFREEYVLEQYYEYINKGVSIKWNLVVVCLEICTSVILLA
jgi:hypothetical protein